jgi:hypothetical protein
MHRRYIVFIGLLVLAVSSIAENDTRTVQSDFDLCKGEMERVERSVQRFQDAIVRLKRAIDNAAVEKQEGLVNAIASFESKIEYFRGRYDRAAAQADKIRSDLKNVNGPVCPSCISSSVNLYCRNSETLLADIEEYIAKASEFESRTGNQTHASDLAGSRAKSGDAAHHRSSIDSILGLRKTMLDTCSASQVKTLRSQCVINLRKADSLHNAGAFAAEEKALDIAELLLTKALHACASK